MPGFVEPAAAKSSCSSLFLSPLSLSLVVLIDANRRFLDFQVLTRRNEDKAKLLPYESMRQERLSDLLEGDLIRVLESANGLLSAEELVRFRRAVRAFQAMGGQFVIDFTASPIGWNQFFRMIQASPGAGGSDPQPNGIEIYIPYAELVLSRENIGEARVSLVSGLAHELRHFISWERVLRRLVAGGVSIDTAWSYGVKMPARSFALEIGRYEDEARDTERRLFLEFATAEPDKFLYPEVEALQRLLSGIEKSDGISAAGDRTLTTMLDRAAEQVIAYVSHHAGRPTVPYSLEHTLRGYLTAPRNVQEYGDPAFPFEHFVTMLSKDAMKGIAGRLSPEQSKQLEVLFTARLWQRRTRIERTIRELLAKHPEMKSYAEF